MFEISALYAKGASAKETAKSFKEYTSGKNLEKAYNCSYAMESLGQDSEGNYYSKDSRLSLEDILQAYDDFTSIPDFQYMSDEYKALDPASSAKTEAFTKGVEGLGQALIDEADIADETGQKDGVLSAEEFLAQQNADDTGEYAPLTLADVKPVFDNFDLDSNSFIDAKEQAAQIALMDYLDEALDGTITADNALMLDWMGSKVKSNLQQFYDFLFQ